MDRLGEVSSELSASAPEERAGSLGPVLDFMRLFWGLDHRLQVASRQLESRIGVTEPQRVVVWRIAETPGISIGEIAEQQHWHSATVTGIVQRLEARGILIRKTAKEDRRRKHLFLTAKGKKLVSANPVTLDQIMGKAIGALPPAALASAELVINSVVRELSAGSTAP